MASGWRSALDPAPFEIWVFQGLRLALAGSAIGLAAAFGLTRLIASLLFGVKAWVRWLSCSGSADRRGSVAVWLPAMRASRVDPINALGTGRVRFVAGPDFGPKRRSGHFTPE